MSAVIKGVGVVFSIGGVTMTAGIVSTQMVQSAKLGRSSEKTEVKDTGGVIKSVVFHGFKKTLSLTVIPSANSIANAQIAADAHLGTPSVSIVGTKVSVTDAAGLIMDGDYNCISATESRTVDGVLTIDLELEAGDEGTDITALVS